MDDFVALPADQLRFPFASGPAPGPVHPDEPELWRDESHDVGYRIESLLPLLRALRVLARGLRPGSDSPPWNA
jgi:hypothetical protein